MNPSEVLTSCREHQQPPHFRLHENSTLTLHATTEETCHLCATLRLLPADHRVLGKHTLILCESCSSDGQTDYKTQAHSHA